MIEVKLRKAFKDDMLLIYRWANDSENLKFKVKTKYKITLRKHIIWFNNLLINKSKNLWVIQIKDIMVGQLRLEYVGNKNYEIDIFVDAKYRGRSVAQLALRKVEKNIKDGYSIFSLVKKNNLRSLKFFKNNNFLMHSTNQKGWLLKKKYYK